MRILFASSELSPLCQSGGLGEAVSGLARALGALGHQVTCLIPGYRCARLHEALPPLRPYSEIRIPTRGYHLHGTLLEGPLFPGVDVMLLDLPALYDRDGLYGDRQGGFGDNALRFTVFARSAAYLAEMLQPDVFVAHDWHAAAAISNLRVNLGRGPNRRIGTVLIVHNNAYQGEFPAADFALTGLPTELFHPDAGEAYGKLNLLKLGLQFADRIVPVSPSYANEVQSLAFGEGLQGVYSARQRRVTGIANGIDVEHYNPSADPHLPFHFSAAEPEGKRRCRAALLQELNLRTPPPGLLVGAVGRFAPQKGWDILARSLRHLLLQGASVVLLGDGDPQIAQNLQRLASEYPAQLALRVGFVDPLARRIYAGVDGILVPSRFEPCGLVQLIAQRYGAIPIAHAVGGLRDTIQCERNQGMVDWEHSNGILFSPLAPESIENAVAELADLGRSGQLSAVQQKLMSIDVSWQPAAQKYEQLFTQVQQSACAWAEG